MTDRLRHKLSASKAIEKPGHSESTPRKDTLKRALKSEQVKPSPDKDPASPKVEKRAGSLSHLPRGRANDEEYQVRHPTGERRRDMMRQRLAEALYKEDEDLGDMDQAKIVANAIEAAIAEKLGADKVASRQKYQKLLFNLKDKKNYKLRSAVLGRFIAPRELVEMDSDELANDEIRERRKIVQEKMTRDAQPFNKQAATTNMFKCGKCKGRNTTYYQMQTRSADEPLTTFVQCTDCCNRWRF